MITNNAASGSEAPCTADCRVIQMSPDEVASLPNRANHALSRSGKTLIRIGHRDVDIQLWLFVDKDRAKWRDVVVAAVIRAQTAFTGCEKF